MEALAHAWVIASIPALHVQESDWRAAFEEAHPQGLVHHPDPAATH